MAPREFQPETDGPPTVTDLPQRADSTWNPVLFYQGGRMQAMGWGEIEDELRDSSATSHFTPGVTFLIAFFNGLAFVVNFLAFG